MPVEYVKVSKSKREYLLLACLPILLASCGFQQYFAKPLNTEVIAAKLQRKSTDSSEFHQFLINNGYTAHQLPIQQWGVDELTYCALFFHPSLDIARAQWRVAQTKQESAAERPIPSTNTHFSRSNNANEDIRPFALGLSIDIPLETASKREFRIDNAKHLSEIAKLEIAQAAWELRHQIAQSLHEYQLNQKQISLLLKEQNLKQEIFAIFQKRLSLGAASSVELNHAKLQLQSATSELNTLQQRKLVLLANLSSQTGLPLTNIQSLPLASAEDTVPFDGNGTISNAQSTALLNRIDIRISLERYAAAETKLKLEIAKQYPDITVSPGYAYEFGDKIWSLGLSGLLTLLNKNKVAISEATQLREVEAAQFEALQSTVVAQVNTAVASVMQAKQVLEEQTKLLEQQKKNTQLMSRRLSAGEIDRLEFTYARLEENFTEKNVTSASFQLKAALIQLENARQQPLKTNINLEQLAIKEK